MTASSARRFYKTVAVTGTDAPFSVALDERPLRTPLKRALELPTRPLAEAVAAEWAGAGREDRSPYDALYQARQYGDRPGGP